MVEQMGFSLIPATPPFFLVASRDKYESEVLIAYELGYRADLAKSLSPSIAGFYNNYDKIRATQSTGIPGQFTIPNPLEADAYGIELSLTWQATNWWRLRGGYTYLDKHIHLRNSADPNNGCGEGNDPHHQFLIQSMINLPQNVEVDSVLRYVDNLNQRGPLVPSYISLDLRLGWRPTANWEFAIVGQNLLDKRHPEFVTQSTNQEIPCSVYGKVTWKFWTGGDGAKSR